MIQLILSFDYEIFGNGSGDVRRDMIEPTHRLLALCNEYNVKVTFFFEVGEYWAMKKAEEQGLPHLHYSPTQEIEDQIYKAVQSGHDVQLHLHPWWIGAKFMDGRWQLHPEYMRITDLPHGLGSEEDVLSIVGALHRGKHTLENMIRPVCPEYECLVYRAAMFWGQPSTELIRGMKKAGLVADSSVISGLYETAPVPTDYRDAPSSAGYWWTSPQDISRSGPQGENVIEFPVCSRLQPYVCNFKWTKLSTTLKRRCVEKTNTHGHGMMAARNSTESSGRIMRKLLTLQPMKFDYCKLSAGDMIRWLRRLMKDEQMIDNEFGTAVVMLGHSKDFWNDRNLDVFLRFIKTECKGKIRSSTLREMTKRILEKESIQRSVAGQRSSHLPVK